MKIYLIKRKNCKMSPFNFHAAFGEETKKGFWIKGCKVFFRKKCAKEYFDEAYKGHKDLKDLVEIILRDI